MWGVDTAREVLLFVAALGSAVAALIYLTRKTASFGRWAVRRRERDKAITDLVAAVGSNGGRSLHERLTEQDDKLDELTGKVQGHLEDHKRWQRQSRGADR